VIKIFKVVLLFFICFLTFHKIAGLEGTSPPSSLLLPVHEVPNGDSSAQIHRIKINNLEIMYKAIAGALNLKDEKGTDKASMFYVSYTKENEKGANRPITFCFNGGPGSSSIWLHMGLLGPKKVELKEAVFTPPPYQFKENPFSLLDVTDLVFLDPISTGYSKAASGKDPKQFHGVEEDIKSVGEFINLYLTRFNRWDSPKFLIGESYGTTRAAGLSSHLLDEYKLYLNGIVLLSSVLDFQTIEFDEGNLLSYILFLPTYTATAWYHKKLEPDLLQDLNQTLKECEEFALNEYASALLQGDLLDEKKRTQVITTLARFTGLSADYIKNANLLINMNCFSNEILRDKKKIVGRFDSRFIGYAGDVCDSSYNYDPSATAVFGAFTATFMDYIRKDLKWKEEDPYKVLTSLWPWNFGTATNRYLSMTENLREAIVKNPSLKVYVGSGLYDLATPYFGTKYTFNHLRLDPSLKNNVTLSYFEAGHMMYISQPSLIKLKNELVEFYKMTLKN
jgi:carboxypeptidase C (cathepsin A)